MGTPFLQKFPLNADSPYVAKYDLVADKGRFEEFGRANVPAPTP